MENTVRLMEGMMFAFLIVAIAFYVAISMFLNGFNKLVNGKGTPMAWIPIANVYLLGKLTVNKIFGWILVIFLFLTSTITTTVNGVETVHTFLPEEFSRIYSVVVGLLFIYAIVKYFKIKKEKEVSSQQAVPAQNQYANVEPQQAVPVQNQYANVEPQQVVPVQNQYVNVAPQQSTSNYQEPKN